MFNENSSVDVLEEVVVEDVVLSEELVEEEVSARRRRASGIVSFERLNGAVCRCFRVCRGRLCSLRTRLSQVRVLKYGGAFA